MRDVWRKTWPYLFTVAACLLVTRDWWNDWLLGGHSAFMDYYRAVALDEAAREGTWWPRFAEPFYCGHGSLLFHFYAPLSYWLTEIFVLVGATIPVAIKIALGLTLLLSGVFIGLLANELFGRWAAAAASTFYVLAPYHLTDLLARHAFGEAVAFAWLPLALWGVLGAVRQQSVWRMSAGVIGIAFLLLTHNITALMAAPVLAAWWLYWTIVCRRDGWRGPLLGALAGVFGLLVAAFFWLPAFLEADQVWSKRSLTDGYFVYSKHFVYLRQFFSRVWGHGGSYEGPNDTMSFQLGLAHWVALAGAAVVPFFKRAWRGPLIFWWATFLAAMAMCHFVSAPVWRLFSILAFVQFPWRFLLPAVLAASLLAAAFAQGLSELRLGHKVVAAVLALAVVVLPPVVYQSMTASKFMMYEPVRQKHPRFTPAEYRKHQNDARYERLEKTMNAQAMRDRLINATARDDFLPKDVQQVPRARALSDVTVEYGEVLGITRTGYARYRADVRLTEESVVWLNRFWFGGWRARIDGREARTAAVTKQGLVGVRMSAGEHRVEFAFGSTTLRQVAWALTALGVSLWAAAVIVFRWVWRGTALSAKSAAS